MKNISADVSMNSQKLEEVTSFKHLGTTLCMDSTCSAEIHIRIAWVAAATARLNRIWWSNAISFANSLKLYRSLVTSILLYGAVKGGPCLLTLRWDAGFQDRALEETSAHLLRGAQDQWLDVEQDLLLVGPQEPSLATVKRWKHAFFGHVTCHYSLSKTVLHGILESWWGCGLQRKCWMDSIKEWTSLYSLSKTILRGILESCWGCD